MGFGALGVGGANREDHVFPVGGGVGDEFVGNWNSKSLYSISFAESRTCSSLHFSLIYDV